MIWLYFAFSHSLIIILGYTARLYFRAIVQQFHLSDDSKVRTVIFTEAHPL